MESLYNEFSDLMDEATGLLTSLEGMLEEDYRSVRELRLGDLYESNKRKESLALQLQSVEGRWSDTSQRLGEIMGLAKGDHTLDEVVARADSPWRESLTERRALVRNKIEALKEMGQTNTRLLEQSLLRVEETLTLFNYLLNPGSTYGAGGKLDPPGASGSFLSSQA